ncbi:hydrogenase formation protein HypD [Synechococcus elongatus]|uniref:Hydrogenase expression/formation protein HypD n=1 Tax=Synechococcus elongatus (strain ATCC 33912 / PCC 7942 / FACHB-805) TaxID=1140 RepID=Q31KK3_SYNE7|nr:hydrogenase formation protein HypD [Synechococcus elongatus]MBD2688209.1 hydrogenase formation protein HypD [Synechococcus elongatus FACHB-1061]ABB58416.1 hydrogenase expression/formation protein HypD [Synechococcus elongatus PCC 7942 = FACHB-805]AJD57121.1 hydrogenase formation protein HupD [Synechococcus elongatus UTEX 2973]MBD2587138.1 hydrogenase formation protein HypD [Synechococcus elongatus FACHB-242]MBD2706080.1 hydrogenase formation protein HypD [Synechococcus elongatus PCC 7942 = 
MRYVQEFRQAAAVQAWVEAIAQRVTRPWTLMEVCGGQTHSIVRYGLDTLLPEGVTLLHGPGCPVCVTPGSVIDQAIAIAQDPQVIICSFGDMVRVPGDRQQSLQQARAAGAQVQIVYSPLDAVAIAAKNPDRQVVFLAVGFETTAPATALAIAQAQQQQLTNFSVLLSHVRVAPAMTQLLADPDCRIQGFLAAGHVCTVAGLAEYPAIANRYHVPIAITGFEPVDILQGIYACLDQLESGRSEVVNCYGRAVQEAGNLAAQQWVERVFAIADQDWRSLGTIPEGGLEFQPEFKSFDAHCRFAITGAIALTSVNDCISGLVLQGQKQPCDCPAFGRTCTPEKPLGAPMVSSEGACAAYYRYRRTQVMN